MAGDADVVVAGGMESMSNVPYYLPTARAGMRMGNQTVVDGMIHDGLWDVYNNFHMGTAAELCAREKKIDRAAQDAYAIESFKRRAGGAEGGRVQGRDRRRRGAAAQGAGEEGRRRRRAGARRHREDPVAEAGVPEGRHGHGRQRVDDQRRRRGAHRVRRRRGAGARLEAAGEDSRAWRRRRRRPSGSRRRRRCRSIARWRRPSSRRGDIDLYEINEAFAVVAIANNQLLELDPKKVNVNGGAVALGHPIGASGARMLTTLLYALQAQGKRRGVASLVHRRRRGGRAWSSSAHERSRRIKSIGVIGAGQMGGGIAQVAAQSGIDVVLVDAQRDWADKGRKKIDAALEQLVQKGKLEADGARGGDARSIRRRRQLRRLRGLRPRRRGGDREPGAEEEDLPAISTRRRSRARSWRRTPRRSRSRSSARRPSGRRRSSACTS